MTSSTTAAAPKPPNQTQAARSELENSSRCMSDTTIVPAREDEHRRHDRRQVGPAPACRRSASCSGVGEERAAVELGQAGRDRPRPGVDHRRRRDQQGQADEREGDGLRPQERARPGRQRRAAPRRAAVRRARAPPDQQQARWRDRSCTTASRPRPGTRSKSNASEFSTVASSSRLVKSAIAGSAAETCDRRRASDAADHEDAAEEVEHPDEAGVQRRQDRPRERAIHLRRASRGRDRPRTARPRR